MSTRSKRVGAGDLFKRMGEPRKRVRAVSLPFWVKAGQVRKGVPFTVQAVVPFQARLNRLVLVGAVECFEVNRVIVGGENQLLVSVPGTMFSGEDARPVFNADVKPGDTIVVEAVKTKPHRVPFKGALVCWEAVS